MGVGFAIVHAIFRTTTAFQIFFASLSISCVIRMSYHYRQVKNPQAKAIAVAYVRNSLIGLACWLCDYHLCRHIDQFPLNPQGHAWWHLFMGLACYHGPAFMLYVRQEELSKKPSIVDTKYGKFFGVKTITLLPITQKAKAH
jgi:dihydroceramidase